MATKATTKKRPATRPRAKTKTAAIKSTALAKLAPKKILITGATGFLGTHVMRELLEAGATNLRVLTHASTAPQWMAEQGVETISGSITDAADVARAVEGVAEIYHLAGLVSYQPEDARRMYGVHVDGTRLLCEAARVAGVKSIVMASTSGTIAVTEAGDIVPNEEWPPPLDIIARWPYYASKFYQERVALESFTGKGLRLVMLNPSLLLGPNDERLSSTKVILDFLARKINAVPNGGLNFVDVRDAAKAFPRAMAAGRHGERYLLGSVNWNFEKFFARLERLTKVSAPRFSFPKKLAIGGAQALNALSRHWNLTSHVEPIAVEMAEYFWYLDHSKAARELSFTPRDAGETLQDTITYVRQNFLGSDVFASSASSR
ncbi:MAG: NAD-dependent epimerase/dehydratase family protein [Pyrinomonadaceae bacterium]